MVSTSPMLRKGTFLTRCAEKGPVNTAGSGRARWRSPRALLDLVAWMIGERVVDLSEDEQWVDDTPVLPETTRDDTDAGWGERAHGNDERLLAERPPHWD